MKSPQAAKLLCAIAEETMLTKINPLRAKKLYGVLFFFNRFFFWCANTVPNEIFQYQCILFHSSNTFLFMSSFFFFLFSFLLLLLLFLLIQTQFLLHLKWNVLKVKV